MTHNPRACIYRTLRGTCCNQSKAVHMGSNTNDWRLRRKKFQENSPFENMREYAKTQSFWQYCDCAAIGMVVCGGFMKDPFYVEVCE